MRIGILALQGAFAEHEKSISSLGLNCFEIRQRSDLLSSFDGLIIPGGESTVQGKLLRELNMADEIKTLITDTSLPVFGTCAGLILLAKRIDNDDRTHIASMDITVVRNAYGRQLGSFHTVSEFSGKNIPMIFIRAPYIKDVGPNVQILSEVDGHIVAAREKNQLVTAFHPELSDDLTVHEYFVKMIRSTV